MAVANSASDLTLTQPVREQEGQFQRVMRRLFRSTNARLGFALIVIFVVVAVFAPIVSPYDAKSDLDLSMRLQPPSWEHPFGTDDLGRDVMRRVIHGARVSLQVAVLAVAISLLFGSLIGLIGLSSRLCDWSG